jgi:hypothetical protein
MAADGTINPPPLPIDLTPHQREILLTDPPLLELEGNLMRGLPMLGDHHNTRSILVQSMDNPRAPLPPDPLEIGTVMEEGVD